MDIKALLLTFDGPSNSRFTFRLFLSANENQGNALTQPTHYRTLKESLLRRFSKTTHQKILKLSGLIDLDK